MSVQSVLDKRIKDEQEKDYHILFVPTLSSAIAFYRMEQFVTKLREDPQMSIAYTYHNPNYNETCKWEWNLATNKQLLDEFDQLCSCADMIIFQALHTEQSIALLKAIKDKYPDLVILSEFDDDPYSLPASHPAYKDISPGSQVEACTHEQIELSDGLIVTNDYLKDILRPFNDNVTIIPNCIDFEVWDNLKGSNRNSDLVYLGYAGGANHADDLELIYEPVKKILSEYSNVRFVLYYGGEVPQKFHKLKGCIIKDFRHWVSIKDYPQKLKSLNFDIGLLPLRDRQFNRCKSNLKYLEYSAMSIPSVASPVEPYKDTTAIMAKNPNEWYLSLNELIENKDFRKSQGKEAYNHVNNCYNLTNVADRYKALIKRGVKR